MTRARTAVLRIIAEELEVDVSQLDDDNLLEDLGGDSAHLLEVVLGIEAELGINVPDGALGRSSSVRDVVLFAEQRLATRGK